MNFERQKRLVERLLERTRAGELPWEESAETNAFQVSFPNNSVQIMPFDGYRSDYQIVIIDSAGRTTDIFDAAQLDQDGPRLSGSWNSAMEELFKSARRKALKADEALDRILAEIG